MKNLGKKFHDGMTGAALSVAVDYGSKTVRVVKVLKDGTIRIELTSKQAGHEADQELLSFLKQTLGVSEKDMEILAGTDSGKLVSILNVSPVDVEHRLGL
jgi:uncharacterized protein YggU (UPF0235/DUF167 family)